MTGYNRMWHREIALTAAATGIAVLALAGCSSDPDPGKRSVPHQGSPVAEHLTRARAEQIVTRYEDLNNKANAKLDAQAFADIEAGGLLEQSRASVKQYSAPGKQDVPYTPFAFTDRKIFIPAGSDADWFLLRAHVKEEGRKERKEVSLVVFQRAKKGAWKAVLSTAVDKTEDVPAVAADQTGKASAVTDLNKLEGAAAPAHLDDQFAEMYANSSDKAEFAWNLNKPGIDASTYVRVERRVLGPKRAVEIRNNNDRENAVYALKTTDRGTILLFDAKTQEHRYGKHSGTTVDVPEDAKPFIGDKKRVPGVLANDLWQNVAYIRPGTPQDTNNIRLLGTSRQRTGATVQAAP